MMPVENEAALIEKARSGDRFALERLLLAHSADLSRHVEQRFLPSLQGSCSVEDLLQDTLLRAYTGIGEFRQTSARSFAAWLKAIADMRMLDLLKAHRRQKRGGVRRQVRGHSNDESSWVADLIERLPGDASTPSRRLARHEAVLAVQVGLAGLPPDQRDAVRLYVIEGKSLEETARALKRSTSAVRSLVHRGKRKLAEMLGRASLWLSG